MRGRTIRWVLPLVLVAAVGAGAAAAATASRHAARGTVTAAKRGGFGTVLVAANGRTLYRYTPDRKGVSVCKGACLKFWPPLLVAAGAKPTVGGGAKASLVGTIGAANGKRQVTYAGFPLYFFAGDAKTGQTKGQGYGGTWYLVDVHGALVKRAAAAPAPAPAPATTSSGGGGGWG